MAVKLLDDFPDDLKLEHDHKYAFEHSGFEFLGLCALRDVIRPEVPDALRKLSRAGVQVKMLTGDSRRTALAIARETGLLNPQNEARALILDGPEFSRRIGGLRVANAEEIQRAEAEGRQVAKVEQVGDPEEFRRICKDLIVLSSARPEDKYALVVGLRQMGNLVAVTGDGTNDGPALNQADVGFAMGVNGTDIAKQAASIILLDDDFASIVSAVRWGRTVYDSVRKFVQWELTLNVVALVVTFVAAVALGEVVVVGVQLLWVSLIIETSGAFALAFEPPSEDVFDRDPHGRDEYIVSPSMLKQIIGQSVLQLAVLFVLIFLGERFLFDVIGRRQLQPGSDILIFSGRKRDGFDQELNDEDYSIHYTYVFNVFALFQWFNLFNCRAIDDRRWNVFAGIWKSKYLLIMAGSSLALHIVFVTFAGSAFRVAKWGLDPLSWLLCLGLAGLTLLWGMLLRAVPLDRWVGRMVSKRLARHKGKDIANRLALEVVR